MPNWTTDQNEAIIARNSNLLVSAAAGSGKTAVLVERIIRLVIEDQIPIDQMLIVTFTNAAASEMRERIIEALYKKLEEENNTFLRAQINNVQSANIMTLHAFCIGVIRNNAHFINVDPGFKVGDTIELNILVAEALEIILEDAYELGEDNFHQFVESYSENRTDLKLNNLILSTFKFIQSQPEPLIWLEEAVNSLADEKLYLELLEAHLKFELSSAKEILDLCLIMADDSAGPTEYVDMILSDQSHLENMDEALSSSVEVFVESVRSVEHMRLKSIKKERKEEVDATLIGEVKALRDQYKEIVNGLKDFFEVKDVNTYLKDIKDTQPLMGELLKLVKAFTEAYVFLKTDKNIVDFNDLEHLALEALSNEAVQTYYQNKFEYIFLDEYQDSNLVQETIVNYIKRNNNVFLVGDVKQSIYRFRLADPSLFMDKYNRYSKDSNALNRRIDLKMNFRSRREILEGINFIFEALMSEDFGEMIYDDDAKLYPGIDFGLIDDPSIQIKLIENKSYEDDALDSLTAAELEAVATVKTIKEIVGQKSYDRKNDCYFDLDYKHIVILMRAVNAWTPVFNDIFMKEGIPLFADGQSGYFETIEIKMFVSLLRLIDNPLQDIPLLTVLRSPIFNFTTDDLINIRVNHPKGYYFEALEAYKIEDDCYQKIKKMKQQIEVWQHKMLYTSLDTLLWEIMLDTAYYQYVGAMPGGNERQGNLRLLIDRAEQYGQRKNLFGFLQLIDKMKLSKSEMGTAKIIGENENVVRIMSIHKSKGLEFPVVIVAGMGKKFNLRDAYQDVLLHKKIGFGPKWVDPLQRIYFDTLPKKLIKNAIKFESLAEEMRVLYVALTRAVDRLFLIGNIKNIESSAKKWTRGPNRHNLVLSQSYLDWVMSILSTHPSSKKIWEIAEKPYLGLIAHDTKWLLEIIPKAQLKSEEAENHQTLAAVFNNLETFNAEEVNTVLESDFTFTYPYEMASKMPSKFSVSELKKLKLENIDDLGYKSEQLNLKPAFMAETTQKTRAEIGTIMHYVMQKIDRHDVTNLENQIIGLQQGGYLTEEEFQHVDVEKIKLFFESSLGQRYSDAIAVEKEKAFVLKKKISDVLPAYHNHDEILIQGIIDCFFEEDKGIILIDYKTDYIYGDEELLSKRYEEQLLLYKEAIEAITHKKVIESYIYSFHKNKKIIVEI